MKRRQQGDEYDVISCLPFPICVPWCNFPEQDRYLPKENRSGLLLQRIRCHFVNPYSILLASCLLNARKTMRFATVASSATRTVLLAALAVPLLLASTASAYISLLSRHTPYNNIQNRRHSISHYRGAVEESKPDDGSVRRDFGSCSAKHNSDDVDDMTERTSRRQWFLSCATVFGTSASAAALLLSPLPASASYSAFTHREEDWKARQDAGSIKISSARSLRTQLAEIAPMNDDSKSKIFCPNGPTAAVSPLMENRCGDRMAAPSVYGRSDDVMGNSIPGFSASWTSGSTMSSNGADTGGFPTDYSFTSGRPKTQYSIK